LVVGGSVYVFEMAVIFLAQGLGATPVWAVTLSYALGTLLAFLLQKFVTFGDKRVHHRILIPQLLATCALVAWNLLFTVLLTKLFENMLPTVVTRTAAIAITTLWNFFI
jgi:putative flippase GtrA